MDLAGSPNDISTLFGSYIRPKRGLASSKATDISSGFKRFKVRDRYPAFVSMVIVLVVSLDGKSINPSLDKAWHPATATWPLIRASHAG